MRIAYVVADSGIPVGGTKGASVHVREMVRALAIDHEVDLFCATVGDESPDLPVAHVYAIPRSRKRRSVDETIERDRRRLEGVSRLRCLVEQAHHSAPYDFIYERYSLFSDVGAALADTDGLPTVLEVNAPLILERGRVEPLPLAPLAREIERYAFERADAVLAVSGAMQSYVLDHGGRPDHVHVVPNGVDTARFHPGVSGHLERDELDLHGKLVIGFTGSLKPWHGVDVLIEAFARVAQPNWRLLIVGDGPCRADLEAQVHSLPNPERIYFTGAVPHDRIPGYLAAMDIAVAPYRTVEDFYFSPLKLFEYFAMGKAVIASDIGQISQVIRHGENGLLTEPGNANSLAEALEILANNGTLRASMAARSQDDVVTWIDIARRTIEIVRETQLSGSPS